MTRDAVMVLRLWIEPHDRIVRARLLTRNTEESTLAVGIDDILAAVEVQLRTFALGDDEPPAS